MAWYNSSWKYRRKLTVEQENIDADLTDFPVYVALADLGASFFSNAKSDGSDIVVTSSDGSTKLKRELVAYSSGGNTGELWFKASSISGANDTDFYIYYGNAAGAETNDTDTWKSNYSGVYHLKDLTTSTVDDSTANGLDGTKTGANNPLESDGKIGKGQTVSSDLISLGDNAVFDMGSGEFALFAWAKHDSVAPGITKSLLGKLENAGDFDGFYMRVDTSGFATFTYRTGGVGFDASDNADLTDGNWYRWVGKRTSAGIYIYVNGNQEGSNTNGSVQNNEDNNEALVLGSERSGTTASAWTGDIDEIFIWKGTAPSDAWIKADYINQNSTATFYTLGAIESLGGMVLFAEI